MHQVQDQDANRVRLGEEEIEEIADDA